MNSQQTMFARALIIGGLASLTLSAWAADERQPPSHHEMREHMEQMCKAEPQKCEEMKRRIDTEREACKQDPEACKKKRDEFRQKMKERCAAEPQKCEEMKKKHPPHEHGKGDRPAPPPPESK